MLYRLAESTTVVGLEKTVNKALQDGWQLQGGTSCTRVVMAFRTSDTYYQGMFKKEKEDDDC